MTIKNKDGSPYRLRGPNPLMKNQNRWDQSKLVFHNLQHKGVTLPDDTLVKPFETDLDLPEIKEEPAPKTVQATPEPEPQPQPEPEPEYLPPSEPMKIEPVRPRVRDQLKDVQKVTVNCLPSEIQERRDPLYGDTFGTPVYGDPFTFEAVIVKNEFMEFQCWATVPHVTNGSVLFPLNGDRRWWKVNRIEPKTGGYLLHCIISDYQPAFVSQQPQSP